MSDRRPHGTAGRTTRLSSLTVTAARAFSPAGRAASSLGLHSPPRRPGPGRSIQSLRSGSLLPGRQPAAGLRAAPGRSRSRTGPLLAAARAPARLPSPHPNARAVTARKSRNQDQRVAGGRASFAQVGDEVWPPRSARPDARAAPQRAARGTFAESGGRGARAGSGELPQVNQSDLVPQPRPLR